MFEGAAFTGDAWFWGAAFSGFAIFADAAFSGDAEFQGATVLGQAGFIKVAFRNDARFEEVTFNHDVWFLGVAFRGDALFKGAAFRGDAGFQNAEFSGNAEFDGVTFNGLAAFQEAAFGGGARFTGATIPAGSFDRARFHQIADFSNATLSPDIGFDGTRFRGLHGPARLAGAVWCGLAILLASAVFWLTHSHGPWWWAALSLSVVLGIGLLVWSAIGGARCAGEYNLMAFENSFRVLKRQSKAASNVEGESLASALELKASRMRRGHNFPWSMPMKMAERFFSIGYELLANYGRSASRPVFFMVASTVGFAALTWAWEGGGLSGPRAPFWTTENHALVAQTPFDADFIEALSFSTARVFPFGPWAEAKAPDDEPRAEAKGTAVERERCSFAARHLAVDHCRPDGVSLHTATEVEGHRLAVRAVAVLQSLFAIVLAFLFGLAVRRRFQIS